MASITSWAVRQVLQSSSFYVEDKIVTVVGNVDLVSVGNSEPLCVVFELLHKESNVRVGPVLRSCSSNKVRAAMHYALV